MKKLILLLTFISSSCILLNAQQFNWGVRGGLNVSSLGDYEHTIAQYEDSELESKPGFYAGLFAQFPISGSLGIETGLFYSQLGGKDKENDRNEQYKVEANPSYLQLPAAVFYKFNVTDEFKLYPSLGVYAGYGLSGKLETQGTIAGQGIDSKIDYFDGFGNKFDFGTTVGMNIQYCKFVLGAHYDRGFTKVNKEKIVYSDNAYNSNFRLSLSYLLK